MTGSRCVVQNCDNQGNPKAGISLHNSPLDYSLYNKWKKFVEIHRANFNPEKRFVICSQHFSESCFSRSNHTKGSMQRLEKGSIPTIWKLFPATDMSSTDSTSERSRRQISRGALVYIPTPGTSKELHISTREKETVTVPQMNETEAISGNDIKEKENSSAANQNQFQNSSRRDKEVSEGDPTNIPIDLQEQNLELPDFPLQSSSNDSIAKENVQYSKQDCQNCKSLSQEQKHLKRKAKLHQGKIRRVRRRLEEKEGQLFKQLEKDYQRSVNKVSSGTQTNCCEESDDDGSEEYDNVNNNVEQENYMSDDPAWTPEEIKEVNLLMNLTERPESDDTEIPMSSEEVENEYQTQGDDDIHGHVNPRLDIKGKDVREEPKGIVFLSKLLLLFRFCHLCLCPNPNLTVAQSGTYLTIKSKCQKCKETYTWGSQPFLFGKFPAGNLLLSFAILCAGASAKKVILVFKHMNLLVYQEATYYYHQRHLVIPSIVSFWEKYQASILETLKGKEVVLAGDGHHDSMGHSAKYGTYTIFCCTVGLIIHIVLVQANEAGSSSAMEFLGHRRAFAFMLTTAMIIKSFVSDRHSSIAKWMRDECPKKCSELGKPIINHFFDLWHIGKKIQKVLLKLGKEKDCEVIGRWRKACVRHFYWSVISTKELLGEVKLAKFESFLSHVLNKHNNLPNRLYNACRHRAITTQKVWMTKGSDAYEKLCKALKQISLTKAVKQASSIGQTSCLEGYHSVVNQFAPKMLAFSYLVMLSRTILAALHFNYNVNRETKVDEHGNPLLKTYYIKYKHGEATVREVKVAQNYDAELENILQGSVPTTGNTTRQGRRAPTCRKCGAPRKGHKRGPCT